MEISVRDIQNYVKILSDSGGLESLVASVTNKFLISDTTLRSFIPPQVRK